MARAYTAAYLSLACLLSAAGGVGCGSSGPAGNPPVPPGDRADAPPPDTSAPPDSAVETGEPAPLRAADRYEGKTLREWTAALGDGDDLTRCRAADAVTKYGPNTGDAVPALVALLKNPDDLAVTPALLALGAIGPAAGEAVDPRVGLLRHKDGNIRGLVAIVLGGLGPGAGAAVPALIAALNDAKAEADRYTFRSAVHRVGKYDVRAVFASEREGKLTDVDLENVIDSLGPDDAQAVAGLVEELKRGNDGWVFRALSGLKRIGPKAAPALPAVRALLADPRDPVRTSAAETAAAIGPGAGGDTTPARDAPKTGSPPPAARADPGERDPAAVDVIGTESRNYREFGYKGVTLGTSFDDLAGEKSLRWTRTNQPWVFLSSRAGGEEFVFDADRRLVCYTRSYDGGPGDYLEQLVELFGKTDQEVREWTSSSGNTATRRTVFAYTFPRVLARVDFVKSAVAAGAAGVRITEKTHVAVIDRAWVERLLDANARGKRKAIAWVRAVGEQVKDGDVAPARLPKIDGGEGREFPKSREPVRFFDLRREEQNREREMLKQIKLPSGFASVETEVRPGGRDRPPVVRVNFVFDRYSPLAAPAVYRQPDPTGVGIARRSGNALDYTPFGNLVTRLNSVLMQEYFPPKTDKIEYVRPASGPVYYGWRSGSAWQVRCTSDDTTTIEWVGEKGL